MSSIEYFQKTWTVTQKTVDEIEEGCQILETENASYTLRKLISAGLKNLRNSTPVDKPSEEREAV